MVLQRLFHTAPLSVSDWAILIALGALLLIADEIRKSVKTHAADPTGHSS